MQKNGDGWQIELPLAEAGYFKAKAYLLDPKGWQHWPDGPDVGISVHPDFARTANTIYCAFTRLFGATRNLPSAARRKTRSPTQVSSTNAVTPSFRPPANCATSRANCRTSSTRSAAAFCICCRCIPTPTTYARFGRFGSPYAALDLTAIDPALVEFDKRTTGIDQFCELTYAAHRARRARVH